MIERLKSLFGIAEDQPLDAEQELRLASAALLVEVSRADFDNSSLENDHIQQILARTFQLDSEQSLTLLQHAQGQVEEAVSLHPYTQLINEQCSPQQKLEIIKHMWQIAFADGHIDPFEDNTIRRISELLYLSHSDFIRMKHWAESQEQHLHD